MAIKDSLTDAACKNATLENVKIRKLHDGQGLYLWVYEDGRKYWHLRYKIHDKEKIHFARCLSCCGVKASQAASTIRACKADGQY